MIRHYFVSALVLGIGLAQAGIEDEKKIFRLCYGQLAKKRVEPGNSLYAQVKSGMLKGSDACMELVNSVQLDSSYKIPMAPDGSVDFEKQRIFQSIFDIHYDIFSGVTDLSKAYKFNDMDGGYKLTDVSEMAYHYTYPFVKPGVPFKSALTNSSALDGLRFSETQKYFPKGDAFGVFESWFNGPVNLRLWDGGEIWTSFNAVDRGLLIGIKPSTYVELKYRYAAQPIQTMNHRGHYGGGAIGANAYISSTNHDYVDRKQAGVFSNMPRNFAVSIMRDVLCRDLPALRTSDVTADVNPLSNVSFRQNSKCMRCHSTIDPMIYTLKNKYNLNFQLKQIRNDGSVMSRAGTMTVEWPLKYPTDRPEDFDGIFFKRDNQDRHVGSRPIGHFRMRSAVTEELIDVEVNDISGLGAAIAATDDFYACSVKRYVTYFTGHDTKLFDPADSSYEAYNSEFDQNLRRFIFDLAADLKQNQDPKRVWRKIFNNRIYANPEQGDFREVSP